MSDLTKFLLKMFAVAVFSLAAIAFFGVWLDEVNSRRWCENYGKLTGYHVSYVDGFGCFEHDDDRWRLVPKF